MNKKIIAIMHDIIDHAEDTLWLKDKETVFERLWKIVSENGGLEELEKNFPFFA